MNEVQRCGYEVNYVFNERLQSEMLRMVAEEDGLLTNGGWTLLLPCISYILDT